LSFESGDLLVVEVDYGREASVGLTESFAVPVDRAYTTEKEGGRGRASLGPKVPFPVRMASFVNEFWLAIRRMRKNGAMN
jgi:hypothetical protein